MRLSKKYGMEGEELREILDALSERTRYSILEALSQKPMTGDEIAESVNRSRSTVESHLSLLLRLGLISRKRDDKRYLYEITPKAEAWLNQEVPKTGITIEKKYPKFGQLSSSLPLTLTLAMAMTMMYFFINSFFIPVPLWLFSLLFGLLIAPLCPILRRLLLSILSSALILSILPPLFIFQSNSLLEFFLSFLVSLSLIAAISLPLWYVSRLLMNRARIRV
jgi:DNA-binding transcriptional ArsR family regulator